MHHHCCVRAAPVPILARPVCDVTGAIKLRWLRKRSARLKGWNRLIHHAAAAGTLLLACLCVALQAPERAGSTSCHGWVRSGNRDDAQQLWRRRQRRRRRRRMMVPHEKAVAAQLGVCDEEQARDKEAAQQVVQAAAQERLEVHGPQRLVAGAKLVPGLQYRVPTAKGAGAKMRKRHKGGARPALARTARS